MIKININDNIKEFLNEDFLTEVVKFIDLYGYKYGAGNFLIDEEYESINFMLEDIFKQPVYENGYFNNITFATRFKHLMEEFNIVLRENNEPDDVIEQAEYYFMIGDYLQKNQIENCTDKDKWYFKNLKLI